MKTKLVYGKRPMLFIQDFSLWDEAVESRLRIVYPHGKVEYYKGGSWRYGCTSRDSQVQAVAACRSYFNSATKVSNLEFLGYL